jgi:hypothetical protein
MDQRTAIKRVQADEVMALKVSLSFLFYFFRRFKFLIFLFFWVSPHPPRVLFFGQKKLTVP